MALTIRKPEPEKLGFLDLPAEIRLQIYPYLLIGFTRFVCYKTSYSEVTRQSTHETTLRPAVQDAQVRIECAKSGADPSTVYRWIFQKKGSDVEEPLSPAILATCRTVWQEATHILYQKNTFAFGTSYIDLTPTEPTVIKEVGRAMKALMSLPEHNWTIVDLPHPVYQSTFAAFVRKIGTSNSAFIRHLKLASTDTEQASCDIVLATQLCAYHLPNLETFELYVEPKEIFWNESPDYYHPDRSSPFWANGPFEPMYMALYAFIERIHWLRKFVYAEWAQDCFENEDAMENIKALERFVTERTRKRNETG